jgi:predicted nucleotidyltransferase component of viral defense system
MKNFLELPEQRRKDIFNQVSTLSGLPAYAVEKDWWVTLVLKAIFALPISEHIVFKGGTSLSKGWNLIERFSEDIDLAIDPKYFGFEGDLSKQQVHKLREKSCAFIQSDFLTALDNKLKEIGITGYSLVSPENPPSDTDPLVLELHYESVIENSSYIPTRVLIEIGARSLMEPSEKRPIQSLVSENIKGQPYSDAPVLLPVVLPKRTFLEKAFLLHEEFQKPTEKIRSERLSRHLYDLEKLMDTQHGKDALADKELYQHIIKHRQIFNKVSAIDYANHSHDKINFIPPTEIQADWEKDYKSMQENMIYGESLAFNKLLERLKVLKERFHSVK